MNHLHHLKAALDQSRFPSGSIRAAVAQWGDNWVLAFDDRERPPMRDAVVDELIMERADIRRGLLRRDVGMLTPLPAIARRGL